MDAVKLAKWKKELVTKCNKSKIMRSISSLSKSKSSNNYSTSPSFKQYLKKSFTISSSSPSLIINGSEDQIKPKMKINQVTPQGCFSVYVGPERRRFVVPAELANHPSFAALLEEAESVYGYTSQGPISLPCDVDLFFKVLTEMENDDHDHDDDLMMGRSSPGCSLVLCSPLHNKGYNKLPSPSRNLFKKYNINHF